MKARWVVSLFGVWVAVQLLDGPIRFVLVLAGVPSLLYVKDILLVVALILVCWDQGINATLTASLVVMIAAGLAAMLQGRPLAQVLFAVKVAVPYLFGVACGDALPPDLFGRRSTRVLGLAFLAVVGGVLVNQFIEWPWEGMQYAIEGVGAEVKGTKVWGTMGIKRIPGFSRSSYDAAVAIALLGVALIAARDRFFQGVIVLAVAAYATVVTTTKGILLNLAILSMVVASRALGAKATGRFLVPPLCALLVGVVVVMPLMSLTGAPTMDTSTDDKQFLLKSMNDRLESCWPEAFDLIARDGNLLVGRGMGGLGIPQLYYETDSYNPCDNLFVFLVGNYGVLAAGLLPFFAWKVSRHATDGGSLALLLTLCGVLILSYGMTANVVENPFLAFLAGLVLSRTPGDARADAIGSSHREIGG